MSIRSRAFPDEGGFVFDHQGEHAEHQGHQDRPSPLECRAGQPAAPTARPDATDRHDGHTAATPSGQIPLTNYVRMPTLAAGLLLMFPGIIEQGATTFTAATGLDQTPYLTRWLLLTASFYLISALCYGANMILGNDAALKRSEPARRRVPSDDRRTLGHGERAGGLRAADRRRCSDTGTSTPTS